MGSAASAISKTSRLLSDRTRQRDFKELGKIGYRIGYNPVRNPDQDWDPNYVPGWYCDFPNGAYDITF